MKKNAGGGTIIIIGLIVLSTGAFFGITNYNFVTNSVKSEARVKSIYKGSGKYLTPTYEYHVKNKEYTFEGPSGTYEDDFEIGSMHVIYYDPDKPEDVMLGTFMNLWFVPVLVGGIGSVFTIVGIVTLISSMLNKRPAFSMKKTG